MLTKDMTPELEALLEAWDNMDKAAQRVLTALPQQMTAAAEALERDRLAMWEAIKMVGRKA